MERAEIDINHLAMPKGGSTAMVEFLAMDVQISPVINLYNEWTFGTMHIAELGTIFQGITDSARLDQTSLVKALPTKIVPERTHYLHLDNTSKKGAFVVSYSHTRRFQALCSALAVSKDIDELHLDYVFVDTGDKARACNWQWFTFALFSKCSMMTISSLTLEDRYFQATDMEAIVGMLDMLYPVRKLIDRDSLHQYFEIDTEEEDRKLRRQCIRDQRRYEMGSAYGYKGDPFGDDITEPFNEEARFAGAKYAHLFIKKSAEQGVYQRVSSPWYGVDDKDEVAYPKNRHDDPRDVDEDAGSVFLTKGTVVFNPFDDYQQSSEKPEPLLLKEDSEFLVIRDDERCRWIDIFVSWCGYCVVPRELVDRFVPKPATGTSRSLEYQGSIKSLKLNVKGVEIAPKGNLLLPLFEFLGPHLETLKIMKSVTDTIHELRHILTPCTKLKTLEIHDAPQQIETVLQGYAAGICVIESLSVHSFWSRPHTLAFIKKLRDPSSAIAKTLRELTL